MSGPQRDFVGVSENYGAEPVPFGLKIGSTRKCIRAGEARDELRQGKSDWWLRGWRDGISQLTLLLLQGSSFIRTGL